VKRLSDGKLIVALVLLLALQAALTAGLQVYGLEPTWTGNWRILKAILAAVNWGGGLCLAFYLRVRWPHWFAWLVVGLGVLAVGAFYSAWYSSWASLQSWVGIVYGLLMAAFDASLVGYGLTVIGKESKQAEAQAEAEAAHKREMERREAETRQTRAETALVRAQQATQELQMRITVEKKAAVRIPAGAEAKYVCPCGRTFALPQAYSAHVRFCPTHTEKNAALLLAQANAQQGE